MINRISLLFQFVFHTSSTWLVSRSHLRCHHSGLLASSIVYRSSSKHICKGLLCKACIFKSFHRSYRACLFAHLKMLPQLLRYRKSMSEWIASCYRKAISWLERSQEMEASWPLTFQELSIRPRCSRIRMTYFAARVTHHAYRVWPTATFQRGFALLYSKGHLILICYWQ